MEAGKKGRSTFEQELDDLINQAANAADTTAPPPTAKEDRNAVNATLRKRTASLLDNTSKKQKLDASPASDERVALPSPISNPEMLPPQPSPASRAEDASDHAGTHGLYVHPSRQVLLDRPDAPKLHKAFMGTPAAASSARRDSVCLSSSPTNRRSTAPISPFASSITTPVQPGAMPRFPKNKTWVTQRNAVKRQWDSRKDDLEYETLLELRRNEKIEDIDRYVPTGGMRRPPRPDRPIRRRSTYFPFDKLPEPVQTRVLRLLLVSNQPITIDFTWLRSFVQGHSRVPSAYQTITSEGINYSIPTTLNKVVQEVKQMQDDMVQFESALEDRAHHARKTRAPCRGLTTSLLRVSGDVHKQAARIFYSQNTFSFPWASTAWMQLESFLATIGCLPRFIEGAILDLTPPVSRLAIIKPPPHDRLLGAIQHCVSTLLHAGQLTKLELELENSPLADVWSGRSTDSCRLMSVSDAEEHTLRKQKCVDILRQASEALTSKPTLRLFHGARFSEPDWAGFKRRFDSVKVEAEKYGWVVDGTLKRWRN